MKSIRKNGMRLATLVVAAVLLGSGCDATTRATVEQGIITSSSSLLAAVLRAAVELGIEAAQDPNS